MLKVAVLVSGGGTNLQAIIDGIENGSITNAKIDVVISNNKNAYALERAKKHDIEAVALSPKDFETRDLFNEALYNELVDRKIDLIVLAGCLVVIPEKIIHEFENRIINIHPSLIPSFCGTGYYGLKVHEAALARGGKVVGATVHFVDEGTDTGPIILQKAVELGAAGVIPVATRNAVVKLDAKKAEAKIRRWQAIAESAAKQSKRSYIPQVGPVMSLKEAFSYIEEQKFDLRMIPYELEKGMDGTKTVLEALAPGQQVAVFIGPEGGFDEEEIQLALKMGVKPVSLGKRILRTETAGPAILALLMMKLEGAF